MKPILFAAALFSTTACQLIVDFDRSRIKDASTDAVPHDTHAAVDTGMDTAVSDTIIQDTADDSSTIDASDTPTTDTTDNDASTDTTDDTMTDAAVDVISDTDDVAVD